MKLYILSDDKQNIFDSVMDATDKKYVGTYNLKNFLSKSIHGIGYFSTIILDVNALSDNYESVILSIKAFKKYSDAKIVFFASSTEYQELIMELINIDVYNIITEVEYEKVIEEVNICFSFEGMSKAYINKKLGFDIFVSDELDEDIIDLSNKKISIAIVGTMSRIGATTISINLASYLSKMCNSETLYIEVNGNEHLRYIAKDNNIENKNGVYTYSDKLDLINYKTNIENKEYNATVYDFGIINDKVVNYLKDMDIVILVSGNKGYEVQFNEQAKELLGDISFFNIVNFGDIEKENNVGYVNDMFVDIKLKEIFNNLLEVTKKQRS